MSWGWWGWELSTSPPQRCLAAVEVLASQWRRRRGPVGHVGGGLSEVRGDHLVVDSQVVLGIERVEPGLFYARQMAPDEEGPRPTITNPYLAVVLLGFARRRDGSKAGGVQASGLDADRGQLAAYPAGHER